MYCTTKHLEHPTEAMQFFYQIIKKNYLYLLYNLHSTSNILLKLCSSFIKSLKILFVPIVKYAKP